MLTIRRVQLRVETAEGTCGADLHFNRGLNVLRAANSSGKSTCMQAVIYALGLEGMLSLRRTIPLPHVMTDSIEVDGVERRVIESWVTIEIENQRAQVLTIRRSVKSETIDASLIRTWPGVQLTRVGQEREQRDFFVGRGGSAQREAGFHYELAKFLGWTLPRVTRNDGSESPLYMECLFPYFFVEQKHGWSGVQTRIPNHFQIRDVSKRSAEFVLSLDAYGAILQRQRLETAATIMQSEWRTTVERLNGAGRTASVVVSDLPDRPTSDFSILAFVAAGQEWKPLDQEISDLRGEAVALANITTPVVGQDAENLEAALEQANVELTSTSVTLNETRDSLEQAKARYDALGMRVEALQEDLQRHKDIRTLQRLGSTHSSILSDNPACPTCQQELPDGFDITLNPMTPEESIAHIDEEVRTYRAMRKDAERLVQLEELRLNQIREQAAELRRRIRSIKDSLTSPSSTPSIEQISERLRVQERIESLGNIQDLIVHATDDLARRVAAWEHNRTMLRELSDSGASANDQAKLDYMQRVFTEQLQAYRFSSLDPSSLEISPETYRPAHEGFDLGFDLSASDMVRVIWAYLLAILETGIVYDTNHLRLLMLDEPRQQETSRLSFEALLARAADASRSGAQIIFATSEEEFVLTSMLTDIPHTLLNYSGQRKILAPL